MDFNKIYLAPLSTFTNLPFRLLCQKYWAESTVVPLISTKAVCMRKTPIKELDPHTDEKCVGVQLFGNSEKDFEKAARIISKKYDFIKFFDLNCGCPVRKVTKGGAGAALLHQPDIVTKIIKSVKQVGLPVSIKMRKLQESSQTIAFARSCEKAGADALFLHARTTEQGYSGKADWNTIKQVADSIEIPVIASGDVHSTKEGKEKTNENHCVSFMIGRAAMYNPTLNENITKETVKKIFREYYAICEKYDCLNFTDLKSKAIQFCRTFRGSSRKRGKLCLSKNIEELLELL